MNENSKQYKDMNERLSGKGKNGTWAMLHINGRNPKECTCDDCADKKTGFCDGSKNPDYCSILHKDMKPIYFSKGH